MVMPRNPLLGAINPGFPQSYPNGQSYPARQPKFGQSFPPSGGRGAPVDPNAPNIRPPMQPAAARPKPPQAAPMVPAKSTNPMHQGLLANNSPVQDGLLGASAAALQFGGPSRTPVAMGQVIGQALQGYRSGELAGVKRQQAQKQYDMTMAAAEAKAKRSANFRAANPEFANMEIGDAQKLLQERAKNTGQGAFKNPRWYLDVITAEQQNPGSQNPGHVALAVQEYEKAKQFTGQDGNIMTTQTNMPEMFGGIRTPRNGANGATPGNPASGTQIKQVAEGVNQRDATLWDQKQLMFGSLNSALDKYEKRIKETGLEILPGGAQAATNTDYLSLLMQMKEFFNLGVLNGPDLELMTRMFADPTKVTSATIGASGILEQIATIRTKMNSDLDLVRGVHGPKGKAKPPTGASVQVQKAMLGNREIYVRGGKWFYSDDKKPVKQ
tara:strand:- start:510 stop:1829 length:1320 start_codon:yes stop_codon:yes gene_type:complete